MMSARSSKKQQQLLEFIDDFIKQHGYGPSYREVMSGLGYKSVSTVAVHVNGLLAKGYIRKKDNSARSIEIVSLRHDKSAADQQPTPVSTIEDGILKPDLTELLAVKIAELQKGDLTPDDESALLRTLVLVGGKLED